MEKFLRLLDKYGLKLGFIIEDGGYFVSIIRHIQQSEEKENAFEELLYMLEEMVLRVKNYDKLSAMLNIPKEICNIAPLVEQNMGIAIKRVPGKGVESFFIEVIEELLEYEDVEKAFLAAPEKFGVSKKEVELTKMFNKNGVGKEKVEELSRKLDELFESTHFGHKLDEFAESVEGLLKKEPYNPDWYLEYGRKNSLFSKMIDRLNTLDNGNSYI